MSSRRRTLYTDFTFIIVKLIYFMFFNNLVCLIFSFCINIDIFFINLFCRDVPECSTFQILSTAGVFPIPTDMSDTLLPTWQISTNQNTENSKRD